MARELFRTDYPDGPVTVDGRLLNKQGRALNALTSPFSQGYSQNVYHGVAYSQLPPPPFQLGLAEITSSANTCAASNVFGETVTAPCSSQFLYLARFRYYDWKNRQWVQYQHDFTLDARGFWENVGTQASNNPPVTGVGFGPIPLLKQGDVIPCYWDEQGGDLIPIVAPPRHRTFAEWLTLSEQLFPRVASWELDQLDSVYGFEDPWFAELTLEVKYPTSTDWELHSQISFDIRQYRPYYDDEGKVAITESCWRNTRSCFTTIKTPSQPGYPQYTLVRVRFHRCPPPEYYLEWARIRFTAWARERDDATVFATALPKKVTTGQLVAGWSQTFEAPGAWHDCPNFDMVSPGVWAVKFNDQAGDEWMVNIELMAKAVRYPKMESSSSSPTNTTTSPSITETTQSTGSTASSPSSTVSTVSTASTASSKSSSTVSTGTSVSSRSESSRSESTLSSSSVSTETMTTSQSTISTLSVTESTQSSVSSIA